MTNREAEARREAGAEGRYTKREREKYGKKKTKKKVYDQLFPCNQSVFINTL